MTLYMSVRFCNAIVYGVYFAAEHIKKNLHSLINMIMNYN